MLAALEMAWHPYFNPGTANTRMDYEHPLNRPLFIALFKQTQVRLLLLQASAPSCQLILRILVLWEDKTWLAGAQLFTRWISCGNLLCCRANESSG